MNSDKLNGSYREVCVAPAYPTFMRDLERRAQFLYQIIYEYLGSDAADWFDTLWDEMGEQIEDLKGEQITEHNMAEDLNDKVDKAIDELKNLAHDIEIGFCGCDKCADMADNYTVWIDSIIETLKGD